MQWKFQIMIIREKKDWSTLERVRIRNISKSLFNNLHNTFCYNLWKTHVLFCRYSNIYTDGRIMSKKTDE